MVTMPTTPAPSRVENDPDRYPVVATKRLPRPRRSPPLLHRYYATEHLPERPPRSVLILDVNGAFERPKIEPRGIRARANVPADAIVVSEARRAVRCSAQVDSAHPGQKFTIAARFDCFVNDPMVLLQNGCLRAVEQLQSYLYSMVNLRAELARYRVSDLEAVLPRLISEAQAEAELVPPSIPGMQVQRPYISFIADTPTDLGVSDVDRVQGTSWKGSQSLRVGQELVEDGRGVRPLERGDG